MKRSILYLGDSSPGSTSQHRAAALTRLGHRVEHCGLDDFFPALGRIVGKLDHLTGHRFRQGAILRRLGPVLENRKWDLVWVDSGWWCGPRVASHLSLFAEQVVLLNLDDPTGPREPHVWKLLIQAIPEFTLSIVVRDETAADFRYHGAKHLLRVWRGYDEVSHAPERAYQVDPGAFQSEVAFIGTRMENRHELMIQLIERGVPLSIWGGGWCHRSGWSKLKSVWRGPGLAGAEYVAAISRAKVCLGLLSRLNRDQHTTRSAEIPYAGGLLCAQRTAEHLTMYEEDREAIFWDDADECAEKCLALLADARRREAIRAAGAAKVRRLKIGNEAMLTAVLDELDSLSSQRPNNSVLAKAD
jgi:spore maturation protein CgeB